VQHRHCTVELALHPSIAGRKESYLAEFFLSARLRHKQECQRSRQQKQFSRFHYNLLLLLSPGAYGLFILGFDGSTWLTTGFRLLDH